jgi:hypothetical protein
MLIILDDLGDLKDHELKGLWEKGHNNMLRLMLDKFKNMHSVSIRWVIKLL